MTVQICGNFCVPNKNNCTMKMYIDKKTLCIFDMNPDPTPRSARIQNKLLQFDQFTYTKIF